MKSILAWIMLFGLLGLVASACDMNKLLGNEGDDDDTDNNDDDNDDDNYDDDGASGDVWTDPGSELMWQVDPGGNLNEYDAVDYCAGLTYGSYSDWRLPSISELRSLIRGCPATMTGGSCGATDQCHDPGCWDDSCYHPCPDNAGPANGCYWPSQMAGDCTEYWSSTESWFYSAAEVGFSDGNVWFDPQAYNAFPVRCVRG